MILRVIDLPYTSLDFVNSIHFSVLRVIEIRENNMMFLNEPKASFIVERCGKFLFFLT